MIDYYKGVYNINLILRVHGSSLYKASVLGLVAVAMYLALNARLDIPLFLLLVPDDDLDHPYGVGVLVSSVSFLIVFRANYSYRRYWDGISEAHKMLSKWGDVSMNAAVFSMQNVKWNERKPRSFYDFEELNGYRLTRERKRHDGSDVADERMLKSVFDCEKPSRHKTDGAAVADTSFASTAPSSNEDCTSPTNEERTAQQRNTWNVLPEATVGASADIYQRLAYNVHYFPSSLEPNSNFAHRPEGQTPPLFLQELAHRASLLSAVALSTLRNDDERYESPLDIYHPGSPLPEVDPDKLPKETRKVYQSNFLLTQIRYWSGIDRTPAQRTKYNASRPLSVIGGVSDAEIAFLQRARGPYAKTQLAWAWLSEFLVREHLAGTMGEVHSAIMSRLFQNLSDGMLSYNRARQITFVPFPFPHAQLSVFYTLLLVPVIPFLMDQFTNVRWVGSLLTYFAVTCLVGMHEVARELENPFRNVPNELPVCTMQARFNEGLVVMFSGFNPDGFWDGEGWIARRSLGGKLSAGDKEPSPNEEVQSRSINTKTVSFAPCVETRSQCIKELRDIFSKQAKEIEELVRLLEK
ncbi:hypothetical protein HJC23_008898 [Cyclotella cryptica]|uniref:Bestrophin homolog n=1 Tax=Cyclotella cryptica TaxID=29204 RepID=A0ABD3NQG7_9STRA|eukprot:CCRYP_020216-RA/>CCRYP_020216-RA protein AED:0.00 eAED:0.00 QI:36/-1/1/1/-1/1/1/176/579